MDYQSIQDKPNYIPHECVIAITSYNEPILLKSTPCLLDNGIFDGYDLRDNLTDNKNLPTECGIYKCTVMVHSYSYYTDCGTEYDVDTHLDNVVKILEI